MEDDKNYIHVSDMRYIHGIVLKEFKNILIRDFKEAGVSEFKTTYTNTEVPMEYHKKKLPGALLEKKYTPILSINPTQAMNFTDGALNSSPMLSEMSALFDVRKYTTVLFQIEAKKNKDDDYNVYYNVSSSFKSNKFVIDVAVIDSSITRVQNIYDRDITMHELNACYNRSVELEFIIPDELLDIIFGIYNVTNENYKVKLTLLNSLSKSAVKYKMNTGSGKHVFVCTYITIFNLKYTDNPQVGSTKKATNLDKRFTYTRTIEVEFNVPNIIYAYKTGRPYLPSIKPNLSLNTKDSNTVISKGSASDTITTNIEGDIKYKEIYSVGWSSDAPNNSVIDLTDIYDNNYLITGFNDWISKHNIDPEKAFRYKLSSPDVAKKIETDVDVKYDITNKKINILIPIEGLKFVVSIYTNEILYKKYMNDNLTDNPNIEKHDDLYSTV